MRKAKLAIIGKGTVGRALLSQLADVGDDLRLDVVLVAGRDAYAQEAEGFGAEALKILAESGFDTSETKPLRGDDDLSRVVRELGEDVITVDLTAAETGEIHRAWLEGGIRVVTANKKPLSGRQDLFDALTSHGPDRYRFEATVGAGLPVISSCEDMRMTGDRIIGFSGMLSGTMGAIFSACDAGKGFADAVGQAKRSGFTEPDPRDDLSGADIARKALILGRVMGLKLEPGDLAIESLVPQTLVDTDIEGFMAGLGAHADAVEDRVRASRASGKAVRYLAEGSENGISVGLKEVGPDHPAFGLTGPENLIVIRSGRYQEPPLTLRGPGAGAEVTAAGVLADIIHIASTL